jgi:hypothetical protein
LVSTFVRVLVKGESQPIKGLAGSNVLQGSYPRITSSRVLQGSRFFMVYAILPMQRE